MNEETLTKWRIRTESLIMIMIGLIGVGVSASTQNPFFTKTGVALISLGTLLMITPSNKR